MFVIRVTLTSNGALFKKEIFLKIGVRFPEEKYKVMVPNVNFGESPRTEASISSDWNEGSCRKKLNIKADIY